MTAPAEAAARMRSFMWKLAVITAAALLFAVAMGAFVFSDLVYVKEVAVGAAVAVLVDAFIVRTFLLPAILGLLGEWAWWSPRWLTRAGRVKYS